jgi:hypothetical protein
MFTRNWTKILPAVTAISTFAITSAFAFGSHQGNGGGSSGGSSSTGTTTLTPAICEIPSGDDDASSTFVSLSTGNPRFHPSNLALQLATFDDDDDSVAYGIVANTAFPVWASLQFDVSTNADDESFLEVLGNNPFGFFNVQGIDIVDLPLATTQTTNAGFVTVISTAAYLSANREFGGPFFAGATFLSADIGQGSDGNTILVQNVNLNGAKHVATNVLVTAAQNCSNIF